MDIKVLAGDITRQEVHTIIVNLFEAVFPPGGATGAADRALGGAISRLIAEKEIKGKLHENTLIHTLGQIPPRRVLVAGLGKEKEFTLDRARGVAAEALRLLRRIGADRVATVVHGAGIGSLAPEEAAQDLAEGSLLGLYTFDRHKKDEEEKGEIKELLVVELDRDRVPALERGVARGVVLAQAVSLARDLVNEPSNHKTPTFLAEAARQVAQENGLEVTILDREQARELGMGAFLAVAQGSAQPPKFIVLSYKGAGEGQPALGLLGKGITFDSGGLHLKNIESMAEMKEDMAGAAACIAAMQAVARLKLRVNVTALLPCTENMPGGNALRPGDVLRAMNGKTIEVGSPDAEGRLILADAFSYAKKLGLSPLVDVATLTGAVMVALGTSISGAFSNNPEFLDKVKAAAEAAGERLWPLPLPEEYKEQLKSEVADIKNTGGRWGGAITAAHFLAEFVGETPWVHLDIAGTVRSDKEKGYLVKGATGVPVRTLVNLAHALAEAG